MRILILDISKFYGGADVRVLDLARALEGQHEYAVAVLEGSPLHQKLDESGLSALPIPYKRSDPRLLRFLVLAIRQNGYEVIDAHNPQSQFWGSLAGKMAGIRLVSTVHSAYKKEHGESIKGQMYENILRLNKWLGCRFIAVTEAVQSYLTTVPIDENQISLIHNSLLPPKVSEGGRKQNDLFSALKIDEKDFVIISVGRLEPVKGHEHLIDAVAQILPNINFDLKIVLLGDGRMRERLEKKIENLGLSEKIYLPGFRNDIPELLARSNLFCMPSLSEGLPYALLEATALKLPLLVSEVGGMAELLTHQENAYLVPPSNVSALAEGLQWMLEHPEAIQEMGLKAHELVKSKFSPEKMISQTLQIYATK